MIAAKERVGFVHIERNSPSNLTVDSLRKRRMADLSDPDLRIIVSRQRSIDSDLQCNLSKVGNIEGDKRSRSNVSEVQSERHRGLSGKLEEVNQAVRREASRFKGEMEVVGQQVEGQAHRLAVLHERAMKEVILMAFDSMASPVPPSAPRRAAVQGNLLGNSFVDLSSRSTSSLARGKF